MNYGFERTLEVDRGLLVVRGGCFELSGVDLLGAGVPRRCLVFPFLLIPYNSRVHNQIEPIVILAANRQAS